MCVCVFVCVGANCARALCARTATPPYIVRGSKKGTMPARLTSPPPLRQRSFFDEIYVTFYFEEKCVRNRNLGLMLCDMFNAVKKSISTQFHSFQHYVRPLPVAPHRLLSLHSISLRGSPWAIGGDWLRVANRRSKNKSRFLKRFFWGGRAHLPQKH